MQLVPLDETRFVEIRIGLHCGDGNSTITTIIIIIIIITNSSNLAVGGICGRLTPRYCFYGETVSVVSIIESSGLTNRIHVSSAFASVVKHLPGSDAYFLEKRDDIVDDREMKTYWLENSPNIDIDKIFFETFQCIQKRISEFTAGTPELLIVVRKVRF